MARPKKAKQRQESESIAQTLEALETRGDRLAEWISENPVPIIATGAAILLLAGIFALVASSQETAQEQASAALGEVQADYRRAMGASIDDVVVNEPANPETARQVREEYLARFEQVAGEHQGTTGGALASLELGVLQESLNEPDEALGTFQAAIEQLDSGHVVTALLELRVAALHEANGRWVEAGEAFERAADVTSFPLRHTARADAARCYAEAGETDRALAAFTRVKAEDPDAFLPEHLNARLLELEAGSRLN